MKNDSVGDQNGCAFMQNDNDGDQNDRDLFKMVVPNVKMMWIYTEWQCRMLKWSGFIKNESVNNQNGRANGLILKL